MSPFSKRKISSSQQKCFVKNVLLEISQNSQENTCGTASFLKMAMLRMEPTIGETMVQPQRQHYTFSCNARNIRQ